MSETDPIYQLRKKEQESIDNAIEDLADLKNKYEEQGVIINAEIYLKRLVRRM